MIKNTNGNPLSSLSQSFPGHGLVKKFLGQTRTQILLHYLVLIVVFVFGSQWLFQYLYFRHIENRVEGDLQEQVDEFKDQFRILKEQEDFNATQLKELIDTYLRAELPEDENYLIFFLDGQYYQSNPLSLPAYLQVDSPLMRRLTAVQTATEGTEFTEDSELGDIVYHAKPLELKGQIRGVFIAAHTTGGERQEVLEGVSVFLAVESVCLTLALLIAWGISARLLAPLEQLAVTARVISEEDLRQRVLVRGTGELADLGQAFNNMVDRLERAFEAQRHLLQDVGHELRTPITIVRGHLELMGDDVAEQQETLDLVLDELDRMKDLVDQLSTLAKSGQPDFVTRSSVDLQVFTNDLILKARAIAERNWRVEIMGEGMICIDRQRITEAMINLIQNAIQHSSSIDTITVGAKSTSQDIRFWVSDTGEGIPPEYQDSIFERFTQVKQSRYPSEGSGLGLSIVRAIVEAHRGHVELASQLGVGSTFTLVLPQLTCEESYVNK